MPTQDLFSRALSWLCTYAVHSSVLLGAVWCLLRFRAPRSLALRERLWKLALVGPLLTATLQVALDARPWLGRLEWSARAPESAAALPHEPVRAVREEQPARQKRAQVPAAQAADETELATLRTVPADVEGAAPLAARTEPAPAPRAARAWPQAERATAPTDSGARTARTADSARAVDTSASVAAELVPAPALEESAAPARTRVLPLVTPPSWPGLVLLAWAALGLAGVALVAGSFVLLWRRLSGREVLREGPLVLALEELRRRAGLRRHVRLSISSRVKAPFSTGLLLPEICLPRAVLTGLTPAQQEVLLAHELGHLLRRDPFWFAASAMLERLFFFQPLNRVARHELSELAELACDDHAVRWTGSRLALASCLTEVAGWLLEEPRRRLALPGLTAPRSPLGRRIARLLDDRRSPSAEARPRSFPALALGTLALTVAAVPGISAASPAPAREAVDAGPPEVHLEQPSAPVAEITTETAAMPTPSPTESSPEPEPETLALDELRLALEQELARLAHEVEALRRELEQRALDERFAGALAAIEARLAALDAQHARAAALFDGLVPSLPPTPAPSAR